MRQWNNNDFDRDFRWMRRIVFTFIAIVFLAIIGYWIVVGVILTKAASEIEDKGLKTVIETIWCGKQAKDCTLPSPNK